jgi:hypothetical protein
MTKASSDLRQSISVALIPHTRATNLRLNYVTQSVIQAHTIYIYIYIYIYIILGIHYGRINYQRIA